MKHCALNNWGQSMVSIIPYVALRKQVEIREVTKEKNVVPRAGNIH